MKLKKILIECGVTEKEATLYLRLLELGSATSGELMKELGFYSKTVYELLEKLTDKGLVSYVVQSNVKYFEAENPERLLDAIHEQEMVLRGRKERISQILPVLKGKRALSKEPQEATIYKGKRGMKSVFEDQLKQKGEILIFGGGGKFKATLGPYSELWHKKRAKLGIPIRLLWNEGLRKRKGYLKDYRLIRLKFLPKEFDNPAPAVIYGDKVTITVWSQTPLATVIRSNEAAKSYRSYFNTLWAMAKR
jgi:predicted DNA-binding transcriptional regulator